MLLWIKMDSISLAWTVSWISGTQERIFHLRPQPCVPQIVCEERTVPLTAFAHLHSFLNGFECHEGPMRARPSWFMRVINHVVHGLERMLVYRHGIICFDEEPLADLLNKMIFSTNDDITTSNRLLGSCRTPLRQFVRPCHLHRRS